MKKLFFFKISILFCTYFSFLFSQSTDMTFYFDFGLGNKNWVVYDYVYEEFFNMSLVDSSQVFESFYGTLSVTIDDIEYISDTTKFNISVTKEGQKIKRTFYDTLSVENVTDNQKDSIFVVDGIYELGGHSYIYGWIFPDTLVKSVSDSLDETPMYPYSRLYRYYEGSEDDSLYYSDDTLFIHYRPHYTNFHDSYFLIDYVVSINSDFRKYFRYYSYFGEGFSEKLTFKYGWYVGIEDLKEKSPYNLSLEQNYPNPFNLTTTIKFSSKFKQHVEIVIYDVLGKRITTLFEGISNLGEHELEFYAKDLSSGIYYYSLRSEGFEITKKCLLLK